MNAETIHVIMHGAPIAFWVTDPAHRMKQEVTITRDERGNLSVHVGRTVEIPLSEDAR